MDTRPAAGAGDLGAALRETVLSPARGISHLLAFSRRRSRAGLGEGATPSTLAALGGAALLITWVKVASAFDLGAGDRGFRWGAFAAVVIGGALLGVAGQALFAAVGRGLAGRLGGGASPRELRLLWGISALPQVFLLVLLLPLDLLLVGTGAYVSDFAGSGETAWIGISTAFALSLAIWSSALFVYGLKTVGRLSLRGALAGWALAVLCFGVPVVLVIAMLKLLQGAAS